MSPTTPAHAAPPGLDALNPLLRQPDAALRAHAVRRPHGRARPLVGTVPLPPPPALDAGGAEYLVAGVALVVGLCQKSSPRTFLVELISVVDAKIQKNVHVRDLQ